MWEEATRGNIFLDQGASKTGRVERLATYKAWSSENTLSGLSMKFLLDLGMSLPSTMGHNYHEMPPKHGQICGYEGALLTGSWPLPAASMKSKS